MTVRISEGDGRLDGALEPCDVEALLGPLEAHSALVLAVSGGVDSMCLMHVAADWASRRGSAPLLTVVTVDHGLRPGSRADALFVSDAAQRRGLPCRIETWEGAKPTSGRQEAARRARYDLLAAAARAEGAAIVTAHTQDDQAETVLMRLRRGAGPDGLGGMAPVTTMRGVPLLRPLLTVPRSRLVATMQARGEPWREDPGNEDTAHERVRLRAAKTARLLLGLGDDSLARTARRARRAAQALDEVAQTWLRGWLLTSSLAQWGAIDLPAEPFAPEDIEIRVLRSSLALVGGHGTVAELGHHGPELSEIERLHGHVRRPGFRGATLGRARLVPWRNRRLIVRETDREELPVLDLQSGAEGIWDGRWHIRVPPDVQITAMQLDEARVAEIEATNPRWGWRELPAAVRAGVPVAISGGRAVGAPGWEIGAAVRFEPSCLRWSRLWSGAPSIRPPSPDSITPC